MRFNYRILSFLLSLLLIIAIFTGCNTTENESLPDSSVESESHETESSEQYSSEESEGSGSSETVSETEESEETDESLETGAEETSSEAESSEKTEIIPPLEIHEAAGSPEGYKPAGSYEEALEQTEKNQLSGYDYVPDQAPILSEYRPMQDGKYVKNTSSYYIDYNTYVVVDAYGREVFRIYRGGACRSDRSRHYLDPAFGCVELFCKCQLAQLRYPRLNLRGRNRNSWRPCPRGGRQGGQHRLLRWLL